MIASIRGGMDLTGKMQNLPSSLVPRDAETSLVRAPFRNRRDRERRRPNAKKDLQRHLARALAELDGRRPLPDRSVHEARKELKRARSTLRLLRDAIGDTA